MGGFFVGQNWFGPQHQKRFWLFQMSVTWWLRDCCSLFRWLLTICILPVGHLTRRRSCRQATLLFIGCALVYRQTVTTEYFAASPTLSHLKVYLGTWHTEHNHKWTFILHNCFQNAGRGEAIFLNAVPGLPPCKHCSEQ